MNKIYGISGLGADERVFKYLSLKEPVIPVNWINPNQGETIISYSNRLSKSIEIQAEDNLILIGVSFGGLVAVEISKILNPKLTILISSIETKNELKTSYRLLGKLGFINWIPSKLFRLPKSIAVKLFGAKNRKLLTEILKDTDPRFVKWALSSMLRWKNRARLKNVLKITGGQDRLLRAPIDKNTIVVKNGGHFMIVDNAAEISQLINTHSSKD